MKLDLDSFQHVYLIKDYKPDSDEVSLVYGINEGHAVDAALRELMTYFMRTIEAKHFNFVPSMKRIYIKGVKRNEKG